MSKLVFTMDELKKISKANLVKVYTYYFPEKSTSKLRKDQLATAIYREANKEFFEAFEVKTTSRQFFKRFTEHALRNRIIHKSLFHKGFLQ